MRQELLLLPALSLIHILAWGLKARVALTMQDYNNAAVYAGKSISLAEAGGHRLMTGSQLDVYKRQI